MVILPGKVWGAVSAPVLGAFVLAMLVPWSTGQVRAVPEIILGGATFFFQTPPPPGHTWSQSPPRPPEHVSALINLPHYGSNTPWPPGQVTSPPSTPRTHCQQNTLHPPDKNVFAAHPPLRIISGTALSPPEKWVLLITRDSCIEVSSHFHSVMSRTFVPLACLLQGCLAGLLLGLALTLWMSVGSTFHGNGREPLPLHTPVQRTWW